MILQPILNIAQICAQKGVHHVVVSPGSRSAALTLAFARHPNITTHVIPDERVAAFVALGMAQQLRQTVGIVCTSGSAAYNLAPAIAEAFFQEIPLIVFTADRPKEWIHQNDGQTMYQTELYGKHVKKSYELPSDYSHPDAHWFIERVTNEAINLAMSQPLGPVHLNVPIREPFYPTPTEDWSYKKEVRIIDNWPIESHLSTIIVERLKETMLRCPKVLIAVGQMPPNDRLIAILKNISSQYNIPVVGDVIANISGEEAFLSNHDVFLGSSDSDLFQQLKPDFLITIGNSFLSKNLKQFLKNHPPQAHWHIKESNTVIDTFQTLTATILIDPVCFFEQFNQRINLERADENYLKTWKTANRVGQEQLNEFLDNENRWNEFEVVRILTKQMPENSQLHLANSMPVRYTNLVGQLPKGTKVFANRGVSGIDGCTSTAIGAALMSKELVFLLTGDVAFFYDRNALWQPQLPTNLRIILLNNGGGNIFRLIDGPSQQPELATHFETQHHTTAKNTANDAGLQIFTAENKEELTRQWAQFIATDNKGKILEIFTNPMLNAAVFGAYKEAIKKKS
jgi:2-succinyl-5-enolpyruvyl-6-hydroxy-3-cyclohexene-1-carboxylate synthase